MNTKSIDKTENICKHCGETYTVFERNRVYGANPQMTGYCSAGCYTESILNPKPTPPAKSIDKEVLEITRFIGELYIGERNIAHLNGSYMDYATTGDGIVRAYNGTIAKGLNPDHYEEIYKALEDMLRLAKKWSDGAMFLPMTDAEELLKLAKL